MRIFLVTLMFMFFALFGVFLNAKDGNAARSESIAAIVNDDVITLSDVNDRMALIIASSGLPNNKDIRSKLLSQILGALIDEQIRLQEARKLELQISADEIDKGFAALAKQNNFAPNQFRSMIKKGGLNIRTLEDQIRSQIAWSKVVQTRLRQQVVVSQVDIDNHLDLLKANTGTPEYLVSEIFLPVEAPEDETKTRQLAQELVKEVRSGETPFSKLAQQFLKDAGSSKDGDLGWIPRGRLQKELDDILPTLGENQISNPIRTAGGFHILNVREKRNVTQKTLPSREEVMNVLGLQRLERLQRRYLLDLKSAAFIENRLGR